MIINRHNYEEFFLLYVDNELNEAQRAEVEKFAQQNPDLAKELAMLQQTTLIADEDIQFENKELLIKKEAGITLANYEEYFLLSIDNELTEQEKTEVEKFVLKHPELQHELALLQQTRLQPEVIEFKDKEVLYRTEKTERRIIPWMRMSIAAAIAGLAIALWMFTGSDRGAVVEPLAINVKPAPTRPVTIQNVEPPVTKKDDASLSNTKATQAYNVQIAMVNKEVKVKRENNRELTSTKTKDNIEAIQHNDNAEVATATNPIDENLGSNAIIAANHPANNTNVVNSNVFKTTEKQNAGIEKTIIHDGVYREVDNEDDDNTIYIGSAQINKNKLKALFKKAANLLDKKIGRNESENTIQIAAFEFKSK